jgi:hypothetical protein
MLRFNDAFKYKIPLATHTRSTKKLATSTFVGTFGRNWRKELKKMKEDDKVKEQVELLQKHKYGKF